MVLTVAAGLALLSPVATAGAAEVHFDPDSPAGKEYALPLDQARDEAAGVGQSDGPAGEKAPLFGEGVTPADTAPADAGGNDGGDDESDREEQRSAGGGQAGDRGSSGGGAAGLATAGSDSNYPLSSALLLVAAVLLVGAGIGLTLRLAVRTSSRPA